MEKNILQNSSSACLNIPLPSSTLPLFTFSSPLKSPSRFPPTLCVQIHPTSPISPPPFTSIFLYHFSLHSFVSCSLQSSLLYSSFPFALTPLPISPTLHHPHLLDNLKSPLKSGPSRRGNTQTYIQKMRKMVEGIGVQRKGRGREKSGRTKNLTGMSQRGINVKVVEGTWSV